MAASVNGRTYTLLGTLPRLTSELRCPVPAPQAKATDYIPSRHKPDRLVRRIEHREGCRLVFLDDPAHAQGVADQARVTGGGSEFEDGRKPARCMDVAKRCQSRIVNRPPVLFPVFPFNIHKGRGVGE